jgi:S-adenosylmethionine decarboxylase
MEEKVTGYHVLVDVSNLRFPLADNCDYWMEVLTKTAIKANTNILEKVCKKFEPYGCSGLLLISESHLSFHSFPEFGSIHIDYYTCGTFENFQKGLSYLVEEITSIPRVIIKMYRIDRVAFPGDTESLLVKS